MENNELNRRVIAYLYNMFVEEESRIMALKRTNLHVETKQVIHEAHRRIVHNLDALNQSHTSNLVRHARVELEIIGEEPAIVEYYMEMIRLFAAQGHSGGSAPHFIETLRKLLYFENLAPITNDPTEWLEVYEGLWQNTRNSRLLSEDGGKKYYDVEDKFNDDGTVKLVEPTVDIYA